MKKQQPTIKLPASPLANNLFFEIYNCCNLFFFLFQTPLLSWSPLCKLNFPTPRWWLLRKFCCLLLCYQLSYLYHFSFFVFCMPLYNFSFFVFCMPIYNFSFFVLYVLLYHFSFFVFCVLL